jgi:tetratricopeptide (TPR) repeat protein
MVGDPLYRPYATWLQIELKSEAAKNKSNWKAYHEFAIKNASRPASEFRTLARQMASQTRNGPMIEDLGLMEARNGNFSAATDCFGQARTFYSNRDDILRLLLEEADALVKQGKPTQAVDLIRSELRTAPDAPAAPLLRKFEEDADALVKQGKPTQAVDLIRSELRTAPDAPAAPLLRKFEEDTERAASQATPSR